MVRPHLNVHVLNLINTTTVISWKYNIRFMRALLYNKHCEKFVFYGRDSYVPVLPQKCVPLALEITHSDTIKQLVNTASVRQLHGLKALTIITVQHTLPLITLAQNLYSLVRLELHDCAQSSLLPSEILKILKHLQNLLELVCNFKGCSYGVANINEIIFACLEKNLRSVSIQEDPIDCLKPLNSFNSWIDFFKFVPTNSNVSQLSLEEFQGFGLNLANSKLFSLIITASQLKKLSLVNCYLPEDPFKFLWRLENLEYFTFHGHLSLLQNLFEKPLVSLKSLELSTLEINLEQINNIFRFEENFGSLIKIKLHTGAFGLTLDEFWGQLLKKLSRIEELIFESSNRCPLLSVIRKIQEEGVSLKCLKTIQFKGFELDLRALGSFGLVSVPHLQQITLSNIFFGSFEGYDLKKISQSIKTAWKNTCCLESFSCTYSFFDMNIKRKNKAIF